MRPRSTILTAGRSPSGKVLVMFALLLPMLLGMVGLVIDCGLLMVAQREAQNAADAAAMAAAMAELTQQGEPQECRDSPRHQLQRAFRRDPIDLQSPAGGGSARGGRPVFRGRRHVPDHHALHASARRQPQPVRPGPCGGRNRGGLGRRWSGRARPDGRSRADGRRWREPGGQRADHRQLARRNPPPSSATVRSRPPIIRSWARPFPGASSPTRVRVVASSSAIRPRPTP